eukprot:COSAG03_NODE_7089_length_964_cov_1.191908_1_plen_187_part_00
MWVSGAGKAAIDSFVRARCTCAQTQCSGHGVCYGHYELSASELQCYCDEGFAGPTCATEAPPTNRQLKPSTASAVSTTVPSVSAAGLAGDRRENTAAGRAASNTLRNRGDGVVMCPDGLACANTARRVPREASGRGFAARSRMPPSAAAAIAARAIRLAVAVRPTANIQTHCVCRTKGRQNPISST